MNTKLNGDVACLIKNSLASVTSSEIAMIHEFFMMHETELRKLHRNSSELELYLQTCSTFHAKIVDIIISCHSVANLAIDKKTIMER